MTNLYDLGEVCIESLDKIYNLTFSEDINNIRIQYSILSQNINSLFVMNTGYNWILDIIQLMEKLYIAFEKGDFVKVLDLVGFEMKPIFINNMESIGE